MARSFNGTSDRLDGDFWFDGLSALMVVVWYRPTDLSQGSTTGIYRNHLVMRGLREDAGASNLVWGLRQSRTDLINGPNCGFFISNGSTFEGLNVIYSGTVAEGDWVCAVAAWDGTNRGLWLSSGVGSTTTTNITTLATNSNSVRKLFIAGSSDGNRYFSGDVGPIAIYTSVPSFPTNNDVRQFFLAHPLLVRPDADACWELRGDLSPEFDTVGGKTLALTGSPTKSGSPGMLHPRTTSTGTSPVILSATHNSPRICPPGHGMRSPIITTPRRTS